MPWLPGGWTCARSECESRTVRMSTPSVADAEQDWASHRATWSSTPWEDDGDVAGIVSFEREHIWVTAFHRKNNPPGTRTCKQGCSHTYEAARACRKQLQSGLFIAPAFSKQLHSFHLKPHASSDASILLYVKGFHTFCSAHRQENARELQLARSRLSAAPVCVLLAATLIGIMWVDVPLLGWTRRNPSQERETAGTESPYRK